MWSLPCSATVAMCASGSRISTSASVSMSRALTSPGLSTRRYSVLVVSTCIFSGICFRFRMMSVASSTTPGNRRELVQHAVDLDRRDRRALNRRQQHAPQRVADRRAESALERLRVEAAEPIRQCFALELEPLRPLKTLPQHCHVPFASGTHLGRRQTCRFTLRLPPQVWKAAGGELRLRCYAEAVSCQLSADSG